ncbi:FAD-binding protein [Tissierella sp.]
MIEIYNDKFISIITGLFAAGEVTDGIHGTNRLGENASKNK